MADYYHAQKVELEQCCGHMTCMRHCPTQAIRVRSGKATISDELCVDCGNCLSVCPENAIVPIVDLFNESIHFKYKVAVLSPILYAQFDYRIHPYIIQQAMKSLGFDEVLDESFATPGLEKALARLIMEKKKRLPIISSYCPAIIRLIQVKYPSLVENIDNLDVPRELVAREARRNLQSRLNLEPADIGIFFIAPCPALIVSIKQPAEKSRSWFDRAFSIREVYPLLLPHVRTLAQNFDEKSVPPDFHFSSGWAEMGSIIHAAGLENGLAVSGIDHVRKILDDVENGRLRNIEFLEALSCMLGCIGGPLGVENPYIVYTNNEKLQAKYSQPLQINEEDFKKRYTAGDFFFEGHVLPRPIKFFDTDLETSIKRMKEKERIYQKLPQIDCGCCGAPTCKAFAEDVVKGDAKVTNCIFFSVPDRRELIVP
jgi:iron only hydrogenase large subunit-like protein